MGGVLPGGAAPAPGGPGRDDSGVGEGAECPQEWKRSALAAFPFCVARLSPEVHGDFGNKPCGVCRPRHANPSDMRGSRLAGRKKRSLGPPTGAAFPPGLSLQLMVLVLPVSFAACAKCHTHPGHR